MKIRQAYKIMFNFVADKNIEEQSRHHLIVKSNYKKSTIEKAIKRIGKYQRKHDGVLDAI